MLYGMQKNGTMPAVLGTVHPVYGVPRPAMWVNLVVGLAFMWKFPGWDKLAAVISVATIISYLTGPVSAMTLRRTAANAHRPLRMPGLPLFACLAFVFSTELLYWAKWPLTGEIILLVVVALPIYFYYQQRNGWKDFGRQLAGASWLIGYMPTMAAVSWAGSAKFGGRDFIPYGWDLLVVAIIGLVFYLWGLRCGWATPEIVELFGSSPESMHRSRH
jgi:amino acid transporter